MAGIRKREWVNKNGTKRFCYEITYYINGKQCRKSGYPTKLAAQEDLNNVTKAYNSNIKIGELADLFIKTPCQLRCKQSTIDVYNTYMKTRLKDIKQIRSKDFKQSDVEKLVLKWKVGGAKNKTINNVLIFLQSVFSYGIELNLLSENPIQRFKKLPRTKHKVQFLTDYEIPIFEQIAKELTPYYYPLFYTAIHTGMRRGELLALEWSDIDFKSRTISVNKTLYKGNTTAPKTLTSNRLVDMSDDLAHVLYEHKREQKVLYKTVFNMPDGRYIHPYNMSERYYKAVLRELSAQLPYENKVSTLRFHDLRHTFATYLLSNGVDVKYVQEQMGHASAKVTFDIYNHVMPSTKNKAFNAWEKLKCEQKVSKQN